MRANANTRNLGRFFVTVMQQAQGAPLVDRGVTHEKEAPFRIGDAKVIRLPFTGHRPCKALVLGWWRPVPGGPITASHGSPCHGCRNGQCGKTGCVRQEVGA